MNVVQAIGPAFGSAETETDLAFAGEVAVTAVYQWSDQLALRAGYQLLWLEGVAIASDQAAATNVIAQNGIDPTGGVFFHGALLGAEYSW
jgi:hypothetical protein